MQVVPLQAIPNQNLQAQLGDQACSIDVYQFAYGLFFDLYVDGDLVIGGVICENVNRIVRNVYLGFTGDFIFWDTQGLDDPIYTGLGSRFLLIYLSESEAAAL